MSSEGGQPTGSPGAVPRPDTTTHHRRPTEPTDHTAGPPAGVPGPGRQEDTAGVPGPGRQEGTAGVPGARRREGKVWGVGVGPGDPELITRKAARLIGSADVVAYHQGVGKQSNARRIADDLIRDDVVEEVLQYPVTTGATDHPGGYAGAMADFYSECARRLSAHLEAGRDVVVLAEGDPLLYGSYMYLHDRLADRFEAEVVPGVPALAAATATAGLPLVRQTDVLTVLPGTLPTPELARRLADTDGAVIMKLGRTFPAVVDALTQAGRLADAVYVERASMSEERWLPVADVDPGSVPYFSIIVVPGDGVGARYDDASATRPSTASDSGTRTAEPDLGGLGAPSASAAGGRAPASGRSPHLPGAQRGARGRGGADLASDERAPSERVETTTVTSEAHPSPAELLVVGLGPGPDHWLTPEATEALATVAHVVGYGPYVARVPQREGLTRHASGNTVEVDRARLALELAAGGERVAVVSGGDAGVFGMASAVFEAAEDAALAHVPIRVLPGVSAVQAVAARAGAPVGADFAVLSLSDRLKPWAVVEQRLRAIADADLVLAVYNPRSRSRTTQVADLQRILLEHKSPGTVVIVGRDVGRAEESLTVTTLADLDPESIDMKCLLVVGASSTRVTPSRRVWTPRFVSQGPQTDL